MAASHRTENSVGAHDGVCSSHVTQVLAAVEARTQYGSCEIAKSTEGASLPVRVPHEILRYQS
jgi:hypothetical protein